MSGGNYSAAAVLLGLLLAFGGWAAIRLRHPRWLTAVLSLAGYAIGVFVLGWPELAAAVLGAIVGVVCWCVGCALWEPEGGGDDDGR